MKSEVWIFFFSFKIGGLNLKLRHWEYELENLEIIFFFSCKFRIWDIWKPWKRFFFFVWGWLSFGWVLSVGAENKPPTSLSLSIPFCFIFHQLLFLHWHYSPSSSPWFFFFISPFLLTKSTFLSLLTFPHPSIFL